MSIELKIANNYKYVKIQYYLLKRFKVKDTIKNIVLIELK